MVYSYCLLLVVGLIFALSGCLPQTPQVQAPTDSVSDFDLDFSSLVSQPFEDADSITVNREPITIDNRRVAGDMLDDSPLDRPVDVFDKIETMRLSQLSGSYTMVYSVPSLDTPVCTIQTKQIEAAAKNRPHVNFVIVSHDTPFALERFCVNHDITNVLTLSDARRKTFAQANGLYMKEYDLMTRAIMILDDQQRVRYIDYADEVTEPVDLLNAFAVLDETLKADEKILTDQ